MAGRAIRLLRREISVVDSDGFCRPPALQDLGLQELNSMQRRLVNLCSRNRLRLGPIETEKHEKGSRSQHSILASTCFNHRPKQTSTVRNPARRLRCLGAAGPSRQHSTRWFSRPSLGLWAPRLLPTRTPGSCSLQLEVVPAKCTKRPHTHCHCPRLRTSLSLVNDKATLGVAAATASCRRV